jgi:hypothetical protein
VCPLGYAGSKPNIPTWRLSMVDVQKQVADGEAEETFAQLVARTITEEDPYEACELINAHDTATLEAVSHDDFMKLLHISFDDDPTMADVIFNKVVARITGEAFIWFLEKVAALDSDAFDATFNGDTAKPHRTQLLKIYLSRDENDSESLAYFLESCGEVMSDDQLLMVARKIARIEPSNP